MTFNVTPSYTTTAKEATRTIVDEPTCVAAGSATLYCGECGFEIGPEVIPALGHDLSTDTVPATCEADGSETTTCSRCDYLNVEPIEKLGHDLSTETVPATCIADGSKTTTCSRCDYLFVEKLNALGHDWDDGVVTTEPTEESEGVRTFTCQRCEVTRTESIPKLNHVHIYDATVTNPTCTEQGYTTYVCNCGDTYVDNYEAALGHDLTTTTVNATCEADGSVTTTCSRCDYLNVEPLEKLGHDLSTTTVDATCEADGSETTTCSRCDYLNVEPLEKLGHDYIIDTVDATCEADGSKTTTCSRCDYLNVEPLDKLGHDFIIDTDDATCIADGLETTTCSRCDYLKEVTLDALGHDWDSGVVTTPPTATEPGVMTFTCKRCGDIYTEPIPERGHALLEDFDYSYTSSFSGSGNNVRGTINLTFNFTTTSGEIITKTPDAITGIAEGTYTYPYAYDIGCEVVNVSVRIVATRSGSNMTFNVTPSYTTTAKEAKRTTVDEPTCVAAGSATLYCGECGFEIGPEVIPALGHDLSTETVPASCEADGSEKTTCSRCDYLNEVKLDALGHDWDDGVVTTEPTEESDGVRTFTCKHCEATRTETIPKLTHVHNYDATVTNPTCTEEGYTTYACSCGDTYVDDKEDALGHNWDEGAVTTEPTEESDGVRTFTCQRCEVTRTETIPKLTHVHNYDATVTSPTCEEDGYTTYTCGICGHSYTETNEGSALGHAWGEWTVTTAATCTEPGVETRVCANDPAHTETQPIPANGHTEATETKPATCTEAGYTKIYCSVCDEVISNTDIPALGHDWDGGKITTPPTETEPGVRTFTCGRCGDTYTEDIPVKKHLGVTGFNYSYTSSFSGNGGNTRGTINLTFNFTTTSGEIITKMPDAITGIAEGTHTYLYSFEIGCEIVDVSVRVVATRSGSNMTFNVTPSYSIIAKEATRTVVDEPTCDTEGLAILYCGECGLESGREAIPVLGHDFSVELERKDATCKDGYILWKCARCDATSSEVLDAVGEHAMVQGGPVDATCLEAGYTPFICSECGEVEKRNSVPALGHDFSVELEREDATCKDGYILWECSRCDATHTEVLDATGDHAMVQGEPVKVTCLEDGYIPFTCSECGEVEKRDVVSALGHVWDEGEVIKEATDDEDGIMLFTCTECGATDEVMIPSLSITDMSFTFTVGNNGVNGNGRGVNAVVTHTFKLSDGSTVTKQLDSRNYTTTNNGYYTSAGTRVINETFEVGRFLVDVEITIIVTGSNNNITITTSNLTVKFSEPYTKTK